MYCLVVRPELQLYVSSYSFKEKHLSVMDLIFLVKGHCFIFNAAVCARNCIVDNTYLYNCPILNDE